MAGISELKDVVKFGIGVGEALADGVQLSDLGALLELPNAISGISSVPEELSDLDDEERIELINYIRDEFDLPDEKVEEFVEDSLALVIAIHKLIVKFKDLKEDEV
jgi:hypothetical protein